MKKIILDRRSFLKKGLKTAAAFGILGGVGGIEGNSVLAQTAKFGEKKDVAKILSFDPNAVCELTCHQILGPCYVQNPPVRRNITSGITGLSMQLGFRIVDTDCNPIKNATVDIWHTNRDGNYSALPGFCANDNKEVPTQDFGRGQQTTNSDGWTYFDTVFPGWYPIRTTHIHATVRVGKTAMVTSQFYFHDRVNSFIYKNHELYLHRPNPKVVNTSDGTFGGNITQMKPYMFATKFVSNKPLKAWKTIVINKAPTTCEV